MPDEAITSELDFAELAHEASNEALCISVGVHVLRTIPIEHLDAVQRRALQHLEESSSRLANLIEGMRSMDPDVPNELG